MIFGSVPLGRAITFVFLGWSVSSVLGMPVHAYIGEAFGWRWAFAVLAVGPALGVLAMGRLRGLPEASKLAAGRR